MGLTRSNQPKQKELVQIKQLCVAFTPTVHSKCFRLTAEGTGGYQTSLSSAPFWSGVIDQPSVTTVTAACKPPSYRGAEDGYGSAIFSHERGLTVHDNWCFDPHWTCSQPVFLLITLFGVLKGNTPAFLRGENSFFLFLRLLCSH